MNSRCVGICLFFFFKQKTAYEMRISDWSSDVCSSDLLVVKNTGEQAFDSLKLDLVMFDRGGVVAKRLAVQAGTLPVGKTSLKVFDVEGNACQDIGSILLNDGLECAPAPEAPGGCLDRIAVSARGERSFMKGSHERGRGPRRAPHFC